MRKGEMRRKRVIVFGFEGKNNKTESNYFSHFKPKDSRFILKSFSCGVTDPSNMIHSAKEKRKDYDYRPSEDLTFLFMDCDCDLEKAKQIDNLQLKQGKDLRIIKTNPCFELWFLNHFCKTSKEFETNDELIKELCKHLKNYSKNQDYFDTLKSHTQRAIKNSKYQKDSNDCNSFTDVYEIVENYLVVK